MRIQSAHQYLLPVAAGLLMLPLVACGLPSSPVASVAGAASGSLQPAGLVSAFPYDVVVVTGVGKTVGVPDLAKLSLGVSVTADGVAEARNGAAAAHQSVIDALAASGIADSDIGTGHFRVQPDYDYSGEGREQLGYRVSYGLNVTVRDASAVDTVIDAVIDAGGNDVTFNQLNYVFSNSAALERLARQRAMAEMQLKATQLAQFAGRELGELKMVSETPIGQLFGGGAGYEYLAEAAYLRLEAGEEELIATVYGVYELR